MEQQPLRDKRGLTEEEYLAQYKPSAYERPSVTVDILLFTIQDGQLKLLLVRRKNHPYLGCWALPGGFVDIHESLDAAVCRELAEETNLASDVYFEQLYTFGDVDRDPRMRVITCAYLGLTPASNIRQTQAGDDAQDAAWFTVEKTMAYQADGVNCWLLTLRCSEKGLHIQYAVKDHAEELRKVTDIALCPSSQEKLAFDHARSIDMALQRLRNKVSYAPIAFRLVPRQFTLGQLQKVYEVLLGEKLDRANFRKTVRRMVRQVEQSAAPKGRRQVMLFRYDPLAQAGN